MPLHVQDTSDRNNFTIKIVRSLRQRNDLPAIPLDIKYISDDLKYLVNFKTNLIINCITVQRNTMPFKYINTLQNRGGCNIEPSKN